MSTHVKFVSVSLDSDVVQFFMYFRYKLPWFWPKSCDPDSKQFSNHFQSTQHPKKPPITHKDQGNRPNCSKNMSIYQCWRQPSWIGPKWLPEGQPELLPSIFLFLMVQGNYGQRTKILSRSAVLGGFCALRALTNINKVFSNFHYWLLLK